MNSIEEPEKHIPYLAGIENFRFRKMVSPGDTLVMRLRFIAPIKRGIAKMKAEAFVGNNLVSEGNMTATISKLMSNNYLHPDSIIGKNTTLEPFSYIDADVEIGNNCWIGNNVTIYSGARIGDNVRIFLVQ